MLWELMAGPEASGQSRDLKLDFLSLTAHPVVQGTRGEWGPKWLPLPSRETAAALGGSLGEGEAPRGDVLLASAKLGPPGDGGQPSLPVLEVAWCTFAKQHQQEGLTIIALGT